MKKNILLMALFIVSLKSVANGLNEWSYPVNGTSTIWELHVIKNDGMDSHIKYRCSDLHKCWTQYEQVRYRSNNFKYVKNVWMEKLNSKIHIIK